ncbi:MAG: hypothetical protein M3069_30970 [Chloroflexota bacterium]|nr:hypothetical protein [Chloroflexota bacterium]
MQPELGCSPISQGTLSGTAPRGGPRISPAVWWQAGDERQAIQVHEREIAPLGRSDPLDALLLRELDEVCERLGIGSTVA